MNGTNVAAKIGVPKYYHLFAGEVFFTDANLGEGVYSQKVNTLVTTSGPLVTAKDIGVAQQGMQKTFFEKVAAPEADPKVFDVFIISINTLGKMTQEQFVKGFDAMTSDNVAEKDPAPNYAALDPFAS